METLRATATYVKDQMIYVYTDRAVRQNWIEEEMAARNDVCCCGCRSKRKCGTKNVDANHVCGCVCLCRIGGYELHLGSLVVARHNYNIEQT